MISHCFSAIDPLGLLLGQSRGITPQQQGEILFWSVVLIVIGIVLGIAGFVIYRRLKKSVDTPEVDPTGFSLSEMRRLYEAGEMSHEEFVQVKERIVAAARKSMGSTGDAAMRGDMERVVPAVPPPLPPAAPALDEKTAEAEDDHDPFEPPSFPDEDNEGAGGEGPSDDAPPRR